jgi:hypothetical protein
MSKPTPQKYKTTSWKDDNRALKARDSLTVWLDRQMQRQAFGAGLEGAGQWKSRPSRAVAGCTCWWIPPSTSAGLCNNAQRDQIRHSCR